jgi:hypothetical protein
MRDLAGVETLYKKMITTYGKLLEMKLISKEDLLKSLSYLLHYDTKNIKVEIAKEWEEFRDSLLSDTTKDRLERYVGMDLIDDHFDSDGKRVRVLSDKFSGLAGKLCKNHDEFLSHLEWLVGPKAKKASAFGLEIFNHDSNQSLLKDIVSVYIKMSDREDLNPDFLGGYLRGMFESNVEQWENTMEELSENVTFLRFFPELIWRSGMSDKTAQLLLTKALDGKVSYRGFAYFGYGSVIANLGEKVFVGWIDFLIKTKTLEGIAIALDLVQYYYLGRKHEGDIPLHPTLELLTNTLLVTPNKEIRNYQMIDHNWSELIEPFVKKYSGDVSGLLDLFVFIWQKIRYLIALICS